MRLLESASEIEKNIGFPIPISGSGKIGKRMMIAVAKELVVDDSVGKKPVNVFVTDSEGKQTMWTVSRNSDGLHVDCELTEDETESGKDWYNSIVVDKVRGKGFDWNNAEYESYEAD